MRGAKAVQFTSGSRAQKTTMREYVLRKLEWAQTFASLCKGPSRLAVQCTRQGRSPHPAYAGTLSSGYTGRRRCARRLWESSRLALADASGSAGDGGDACRVCCFLVVHPASNLTSQEGD